MTRDDEDEHFLRAGEAAGLYDNVLARHFDKQAIQAAGHQFKKYGKTIVAHSEGDLYQAITGRRSAVFDACATQRKSL